MAPYGILAINTEDFVKSGAKATGHEEGGVYTQSKSKVQEYTL